MVSRVASSGTEAVASIACGLWQLDSTSPSRLRQGQHVGSRSIRAAAREPDTGESRWSFGCMPLGRPVQTCSGCSRAPSLHNILSAFPLLAWRRNRMCWEALGLIIAGAS